MAWEVGRTMARDEQWERELKDELKRAAKQLVRGLADTLESRAEEARRDHETRRERRRRQREEAREERLAEKLAKDDRRLARTSPLEGWVFATVALACLVFAFVNMQQLWWMVFPALGFGSRAGQVLGYHQRQRRRAELETKVAERERKRVLEASKDPRERRIEERCDRLLAAVNAAPESVRTFLSNPEQTIGTLRKTCLDLLAKEKALRSLADPAESARLAKEREELATRIETSRDPVVRERLQGALAALDQQREQYEVLVRNANRLEAEQTRLGYTLDGLHAQVVRLSVAGAGEGASDALRRSVDEIRAEVGALADALEQVNLETAANPVPHLPKLALDRDLAASPETRDDAEPRVRTKIRE